MTADNRDDSNEVAPPPGEAVSGQNILGDLRISELLNEASKLIQQAVVQPAGVASEGVQFLKKLGKIAAGQGSWLPDPADKRFADPAWKENDFYRNWLQAYMAWSESLQNYASTAGSGDKESGRAKFLLQQVSEALAPTNFLLGNPAALKQALESGGKSLLDGYKNFLTDAAARRPVPSQVDARPFKVGENLAATPGDVIFREEMFELLQYRPQTEQVRTRPILIIPSIVNKYYAFDLAPGRSLTEYLVKNGFTVFTMVFRNPQKEHDHWGIRAYMDAMDAAIDVVRDASGEDPNLFVVCGSGPVLASLLSKHIASGQRKANSLTLFVSQLDAAGMSEIGGIGEFIDPKVPKLSDHFPGKSDRISADEFTLLFAMLRPNDLIWNYWVNNYLMGKDPPPFDILAWNADGTNMTSQFTRDFRDFLKRNPLVTPGTETVAGVPSADLGDLGIDSYVIGARNDHICPWRTVYRSAQMLGERATFVLGGSGHIQTIVSPPGSAKSVYFVNSETGKAADEWLDAATTVQGTWWEHFVSWCHERSGALKSAPASPGNARFPSLGPAPGTYVHESAS